VIAALSPAERSHAEGIFNRQQAELGLPLARFEADGWVRFAAENGPLALDA
jgi:hypothetical protein